MKKIIFLIIIGLVFFVPGQTYAAQTLISTGFDLKALSLTYLLSFLIRMFFVIAALAALLFLLLGALAWVTSGGEKEAVKKAQDKIQGAVVGLIIIVAVLAILVTLETIVFKGTICVGLTCPVTIPGLIKGDRYIYRASVDNCIVLPPDLIDSPSEPCKENGVVREDCGDLATCCYFHKSVPACVGLGR